MSNCECEGSCPSCRIGEVDNHKCNKCFVEFCPNCHGVRRWGSIKNQNVLECKCDPLPDLLEALKRIAEGQWPSSIPETEGTLAMRQVARAAIAKAEGAK